MAHPSGRYGGGLEWVEISEVVAEGEVHVTIKFPLMSYIPQLKSFMILKKGESVEITN
jgi:hypothetical protein